MRRIHQDSTGRKFRSTIQYEPTFPEKINLADAMGKGQA